MEIVERNLQSIGKSLLVTLPKSWTNSLQLKKGSTIKIAVTEQGQLLIAPEFTKPERKKSAVIQYNNFFLRRFFREYFAGNEKITIISSSAFTSGERKNISSVINRFMNVQVIEELQTSVVVKVFRVEELSIEECMNRMHYLSLGMIDEILAGGEVTKLAEIEDALTKFYYALVLLIRQFLTEGKFVGQSISLVRAMDYRMAAEKIERIGDLLKDVTHIGKEEKELLKQCKEFYKRSFSAFMSNNFDKAVVLWDEERTIRKKYEKYSHLLDLIVYSRQISSYAR